jgi:hypothetical protein
MTNHKPRQVVIVDADLLSAMEMVAEQSNNFVNWIGSLLPELSRPQIGYLSATLLSMYLDHLKSDPDAIASIKDTAEMIKNIDYAKTSGN